jgi:hypothetical protein
VWIFVGWDFIETVLWYFFWWVIYSIPLRLWSYQLSNTFFSRNSVEAQGRTLEELEWVYNQPNPVKASLHVDKVLVRGDGVVTEKIIES